MRVTVALAATLAICALPAASQTQTQTPARSPDIRTWEVSPAAAFWNLRGNGLGTFSTRAADARDTRLRNGIAYGLRLTGNTRGYYGHEFTYLRLRGTADTTIKTGTTSAPEEVRRRGRATIQQAQYTFLMYMMPNGERWRPYLAVGAQAGLFQRPRIEEWTGRGTRNYGAHYGAGIKFRAGRVIFRMDGRHFIGGKPYNLTFPQTSDPLGFPTEEGKGKFKYLEGSVGIGFTF